MKKLMFATLSLVGMFAISSGTGTRTAAAAPDEPQIGACRWYCYDGGTTKTFVTQAACDAACSSECDQIC
jgi:hypothetical protein